MQNTLRRWKALWDPNRYHGWGKTKNYFEGWYFKIVDPTENQVWALIPGISYPKEGEAHAFIQVVDGKNQRADYVNFKAEAFVPDPDRFALQLGNNFFSANKIVLDLPQLKGELHLENITPWPKMLYAPGRGQSFPSSWIWMQSNHFPEDEPICISASVANIPWLGSHFIGYIVGFLYKGKIHRFATYTGAKMKASLDEEQVRLSFKDFTYRLEIVATRAAGSDLVSPISGEMRGKVNESIQAKIQVRFFKKEQLLYEGIGKNAGLEIAGPVEKLLTAAWRR